MALDPGKSGVSRSAIARILGVVAVVAVLGVLPTVLNAYHTQVFTSTFYFVILGVSWNLVAGFTGQFSVAHHALATVGAYSSAGMVLALGAPAFVGVLAGGASAVVLGYLLAWVTLKSRGIYFALSTWAFAETVRIMLSQQYRITRGDNGLSVPFLFGTIEPWPYYYTFLAAAVGSIVVSIVLLRRKMAV